VLPLMFLRSWHAPVTRGPCPRPVCMAWPSPWLLDVRGRERCGRLILLAGQAWSNVIIVADMARSPRPRVRPATSSVRPPHCKRRFVRCIAEIVTGSGTRLPRRPWLVRW